MVFKATKKRLKYLFTLHRGLGITKADFVDTGVPCVSYGQIHTTHGFEVAPECRDLPFVQKEYLETNQDSLLKFGDFVFADTSENLEGSGNFTYLNNARPTFAGYHTIIARPNAMIASRYLAYFFDSPAFRTQIQREVNRVKVYSITQRILKNAVVSFPPRAEQDQIVRFLDWKVGAIDRLVAAKKKQIGLLGELSQYQIKSLLDKIDTKKKLTAVTTKIGSGKTPRGGAAVYIDDGVLFIRSQNVLHRELQISNASYISEETDESMRSTRVFKNDVLLNITGGSIGRSCVYTFDNHANVNQHVCIIRPNTEHILPAFLALYLSSPEGQVKVKSCQNEGNRESLTFVQIGEFEVPCPPLETQRRIAAALDAKTARLDKAAQNLSIEIALLAEYRARLISDAVTGKLDVRGGAAPEHGIVDESTGINDDAAESGGK